MPTGYTANIENGITFQEYALGCARAFGALIMMRDDPVDAPIPDAFEPSDYDKKRKAAAETRIAEILAMTPEECDCASKVEFDKRVAEYSDAIDRHNALRAKYEAMLDKVIAYVPPSDGHREFKSFMQEQIESSIKGDCDNQYYQRLLDEMIEPLSGDAWRSKEIESCQDIIARATKGNAEEEERTAKRNLWIQQLKESLK